MRNFGLKVGMVGKVKFEARIKELVENQPDLAELVEPLLIVLRALRKLSPSLPIWAWRRQRNRPACGTCRGRP